MDLPGHPLEVALLSPSVPGRNGELSRDVDAVNASGGKQNRNTLSSQISKCKWRVSTILILPSPSVWERIFLFSSLDFSLFPTPPHLQRIFASFMQGPDGRGGDSWQAGSFIPLIFCPIPGPCSSFHPIKVDNFIPWFYFKHKKVLESSSLNAKISEKRKSIRVAEMAGNPW